MAINSVVVEQLARVNNTLRDAIVHFPEEEWRTGVDEYLVPARLAYHAIETVEFYLGEIPEGFQWGHRFGVNWEGAERHQLPTQEQMLAYLDEVEAWGKARLLGMTDDDLLGDNPFAWTGENTLARMIYLARHTQHHVAELNLELRRRNLPTADWR